MFEGVDGSGKTTQVAITRDSLVAKGYKVATFAFPDRTTITGQAIDKALKGGAVDSQTLYELFLANRHEKKDTLQRALAANDFVLIDRYSYSGIAYARAHGCDLDIRDALAADLCSELPAHIIFYLPYVCAPVVEEIFDRNRVMIAAEYERIWSMVDRVIVPVAAISKTNLFIVEHLTALMK